jgi:photosystem II stability/assembly factor-like uncharacterized protein
MPISRQWWAFPCAALCAALALGVPAGDILAQEASLQEIRQGTHIHGLAVSRADPTQLYIATHHGLFILKSAGKATRISPVQDFMGFAAHPGDASVFYASGHPQNGGNLGFIMSADGGANWTQVSPGVDGPVDFHQMSVSRADPNVIYGAHGAIQVSRDGGRNWEVSGAAPEGLIGLAASSHAPERLFAATKAGLKVSADAGASWRDAGLEGRPVSLVSADGQGGLIAFALGLGLVRAPGEDVTAWETLSGEFGESIPLHIAIDPADASRLYIATQDNRLLASVDGGRTWSDLGAR